MKKKIKNRNITIKVEKNGKIQVKRLNKKVDRVSTRP